MSNSNREWKQFSAIGVALVTTATGLIIAIPTLVSLTFLRSRIRRIQAEFEEIFIDVIKSVKRADAATSDAATESKEAAGNRYRSRSSWVPVWTAPCRALPHGSSSHSSS